MQEIRTLNLGKLKFEINRDGDSNFDWITILIGEEDAAIVSKGRRKEIIEFMEGANLIE